MIWNVKLFKSLIKQIWQGKNLFFYLVCYLTDIKSLKDMHSWVPVKVNWNEKRTRKSSYVRLISSLSQFNFLYYPSMTATLPLTRAVLLSGLRSEWEITVKGQSKKGKGSREGFSCFNRGKLNMSEYQWKASSWQWLVEDTRKRRNNWCSEVLKNDGIQTANKETFLCLKETTSTITEGKEKISEGKEKISEDVRQVTELVVDIEDNSHLIASISSEI